VGFYGVTVGTKGPALNPQVITAMLDLGLSDLRFQVPWELVERRKGVYNWSLWDDAVAKCNAAGLNITLTIKESPAFWQIRGLPSPQGTALIAEAIASRYNGTSGYGSIAGIEIGNEDYDSAPHTSPLPLAIALQAAYPVIKAVQPALPVYMGAILQRNSTHIKAFMDGLWAQAKGCFDIANFHFYTCIPGNGHFDPSDSSVHNVPSLAQFIAILAQSHAQAGCPNFPTRCTEFGFAVTSAFGRPARCVCRDQETQWQYLEYCYDQLRQAGFIVGADVFTLGFAHPPDGMSLIQNGGAKTIAYQQLKMYIAQNSGLSNAAD
jgi:hypothetical protein